MLQKVDFLGKSVSQIVFGCDSLGLRLPTETSNALLDLYIENGGNFLDTARIYSDGRSEGFVGQYLKSRHLQDKILVATKAGHPPLSDMHQSRLSYTELESDIDTSLKELQTDCIDLLWLHRDDEAQPAEQIVQTMNLFIKKGKIKNYAVSNWRGERIKTANIFAQKEHLSPIVASQIQYNIALHNGLSDDTCLEMTQKEFDFYKQEKTFPVFAYSSQAKGFFEKYLTDSLSSAASRDYLNAQNMSLAKKLQKQALQTGKTVSELALELLLNQSPFPVFPIIGASNTQQLRQTLGI